MSNDSQVDEATIDDVESFCDRLQAADADRVVVRWIDEMRPVSDEEGVTVRDVQEATIKSAVDGELVEDTFEGLDHRTLRQILAPYDFEVLYRTDNLT